MRNACAHVWRRKSRLFVCVLTGRWSNDEHAVFVRALKLYGRDWKAIQQLIPTRSMVQVRTHAQKYLAKLGKVGGQVFMCFCSCGSAATVTVVVLSAVMLLYIYICVRFPPSPFNPGRPRHDCWR